MWRTTSVMVTMVSRICAARWAPALPAELAAQHRQVHAQRRQQLAQLVVHLACDALALLLDHLALVATSSRSARATRAAPIRCACAR
jgi:hypothetical protein